MTLDQSMDASPATHDLSERLFGVIVGGIFLCLGTVPLLWGGEGKMVFWGLAAVVLALGLVVPALLKWPKRIWFGVTGTVARVVNWVLLLVLFALVVTPVAIWFRVWGRDMLRRRWDTTSKSYWVDRGAGALSGSMEKQF